jgi:hypothetical protein
MKKAERNKKTMRPPAQTSETAVGRRRGNFSISRVYRKVVSREVTVAAAAAAAAAAFAGSDAVQL